MTTTNKKIKEDHTGLYEWIQTENGGFWSKIESLVETQHRVPFSCPGCSKLMMNIDDAPFYRLGVCVSCEIDWVEGRNLPDEIRCDRQALVRWVKEKIEEKQKYLLSKKEE